MDIANVKPVVKIDAIQLYYVRYILLWTMFAAGIFTAEHVSTGVQQNDHSPDIRIRPILLEVQITILKENR